MTKHKNNNRNPREQNPTAGVAAAYQLPSRSTARSCGANQGHHRSDKRWWAHYYRVALGLEGEILTQRCCATHQVAE